MEILYLTNAIGRNVIKMLGIFNGVNISIVKARQEIRRQLELELVSRAFLKYHEHYFTIGCDAPNALQVAERSLLERKAI